MSLCILNCYQNLVLVIRQNWTNRVEEICGTGNDEVSKFWVQYLQYLDLYVGYYFSIRSGNWSLRNACLKQIINLFFSYSKPNYEKLCTETLFDILCLPEDILTHFQNGEWTVSLKGFP